MNPRISLCMIVRDEEAHLGRCLRSVQPYVDEIIVVDTGSTDGTVEIARQYGAQVYHHPWENDFSKHRNQSVGYATGEWILRLDADEELVQEDGPLLRKTVAEGKADYYFLQFHDLHHDGSEHGVFYQIRLFRNGRGMIFERKVHEQLRLKGKGAYAPIRINHYGYDLSPEQMEQKCRARLQLLAEILAADPGDIYSRHQLASCYSMHQDFAEAVRHGEMVLEARRKRQLTNSFFITTYYTVGQGYLALGNLEQARCTFREALEFFPYHLDACYNLIVISLQQGNWSEGQTFAERYLQIRDAIERDPSLMGSYCHHLNEKDTILYWLGTILFHRNDGDQAAEMFQQAYDISPHRAESAEAVALFYLNHHRDDLALPWLTRALEEGRRCHRRPKIFESHRRLYYLLGQHYADHGLLDAARECFDETDDDALSSSERGIKYVSLAQISWKKQEIDAFVKDLSRLIELSHAQTIDFIDRIEDIGTILYDVTEAFHHRGEWQPAIWTLRLALDVAPTGFDRARFADLLSQAANQIVLH